MRASGPWVKDKHHYLRRYCQMFTVGMRQKWGRLSYYDFMAGPGRCLIESSGEMVVGSPLVALEKTFDKYTFYESEGPQYAALQQRVLAHPKAALCSLHQEKWDKAVLSPGFTLPPGLVLAFLDPTGIRQVPWNAVNRVATLSRHVDILMTIQHGMGIKLNKHQYCLKSEETAVDAFLGRSDWRSNWRPHDDFCRLVLSEYTDNMKGLGFDTRRWSLIRTSSGTGLYYVCLFSRHPRALDFWDKVGLKDEAGQIAMNL